ncbi:unnamed protein product [Rotaria socialis]|uniref:Uncharacterized protein n=1 Tax=Rotaria socialis TaxID=392032 RepID=A0A818ZG48_9BILA|nr:unnamed protein product [Rotaria socialis]CAF4504681.1 unnamed protein product [Rotaria socialis]
MNLEKNHSFRSNSFYSITDMNNHRLLFSLILILTILYLTSSSHCGPHSHQDDMPFDDKVQQSPLVLIGTSLNKNFDPNIANLFNVTYLVRCILKGSPTKRIIRIVQAGSLLGRRSCQRFDVNREYIAFLEPFFDETYRPVDLEEIQYSFQINDLLEKACGLSRTYPFTETNDTEASSTSKCPSAVSTSCAKETTKATVPTSTKSAVVPTTKSMNPLMFGQGTMDYAILSLLLADYQRQNLSLAFLQGDNPKLLFSDDEARKNQANQYSFMIIITLLQFISCSIIRLFL